MSFPNDWVDHILWQHPEWSAVMQGYAPPQYKNTHETCLYKAVSKDRQGYLQFSHAANNIPRQSSSVPLWQHVDWCLHPSRLCGIHCVQCQRQPLLHCDTHVWDHSYRCVALVRLLRRSFLIVKTPIVTLPTRSFPVPHWAAECASVPVDRRPSHLCHGLWSHLLPLHLLLHGGPGIKL